MVLFMLVCIIFVLVCMLGLHGFMVGMFPISVGSRLWLVCMVIRASHGLA